MAAILKMTLYDVMTWRVIIWNDVITYTSSKSHLVISALIIFTFRGHYSPYMPKSAVKLKIRNDIEFDWYPTFNLVPRIPACSNQVNNPRTLMPMIYPFQRYMTWPVSEIVKRKWILGLFLCIGHRTKSRPQKKAMAHEKLHLSAAFETNFHFMRAQMSV